MPLYATKRNFRDVHTVNLHGMTRQGMILQGAT